MTNFRRLRTEQGFIYAPAAINAAMDAQSLDIAHAVMASGVQVGLTNVGWHVVDGLEVYSEGDNDIAMTAGVAVSRASSTPRVASLWNGLESYATSLPAPDLTNPRIDLVCLVVTDGPLASSSQGRVGDVPASVATQSGATVVITVVEGTPDAAPVAPALPADAILLAHCLTEVGGAVTILDKRTMAATPRHRIAGEVNRYVRDTLSNDDVVLLTIFGRSATLDAMGPVGTPFQSSLKWDAGTDMLVFERDRGLTDESAGDHALMMIPGGRTYQITRPVQYADPAYWWARSLGTKPLGVYDQDTDAKNLQVAAVDFGVDRMVFPVPIEVDVRGLELGAAGVIFSATSMTSTTMTVKFQHRGKFSATWTDVASKTFTINTTFAQQEWALDLVSPVVATGCVRFLIDVNKMGGGAGGAILINGVAFAVIEGRA